jgi:DNA mismatch repair protein MLH3
VERFLKELCLGYLSNVNARGDKNNFLRLRDLTPPVPILLSWQEERQLRNLSTGRVFEHWGFNFVEPSAETSYKTEQGLDAGSTSGYSQVFVRCVPEVVADKVSIIEIQDLRAYSPN